jgi:tRNA-2-methylthio-N6-dimethylallyladenosine synthase
VPLDVKKRRLQEMVDLYRGHSLLAMQKEVGKTRKVLIEGPSKKSENDLYGRTDQNKVVVFEKGNLKVGEYANVFISSCTAGTLIGSVVEKS